MGTWKKLLLSGSVVVILAASTATHALTDEEIPAQLQALYEAVALVQAQIQLYTYGTGVTPASPATKCLRLVSSLRLGHRDEYASGPVSSLQQFLKSTGDFTYPEITGYFGPATQTALQKFQSRGGIVSSGTPETTGHGVAGPRTREYIQSISCAVATPTIPAPAVSLPGGCGVNGMNVKNGDSIRLYSVRTAPSGQSCSAYITTRTCINGVLGGNTSSIYSSCSSIALRSCTIGSTTIASGESRTLYDKASVSSGDTCTAHSLSRKCTDGALSGSSLFGNTSCEGPRTCTLDGATVSDGQSQGLYFLKNISAGEMCSSYAISRKCTDGTLSGDSSYKYSSCTPVATSSCAMDNVVLGNGSSATFFSSLAAPAGQACSVITQIRMCTNGTLSGGVSYNRASCTDNAACTLDGTSLSHGASFTFYGARVVPFGTTCSSVSKSRMCTNGALSEDNSYKYASCAVAPPSSCTLDNTTLTTGSSGTFYKERTVPYGSTCASITRTCASSVLGGDSTYQYASCEVITSQQGTTCVVGEQYAGGSFCPR